MNKQAIALRLQQFYMKYKKLPSYREMMHMFGYSSKGSAHYVIKQLIEEGLLEKDENGKLMPKDLLTIPHLGTIRAGYPTPGHTVDGRGINLHDLFSDVSSGSFALTVRGDSMKDEGINDGDLVIVAKKNDIRNGDVVAAVVDGEWTVKYFEKKEGQVSLIPANKDYPVIRPQFNLEIGGVVVHVIRSYR